MSLEANRILNWLWYLEVMTVFTSNSSIIAVDLHTDVTNACAFPLISHEPSSLLSAVASKSSLSQVVELKGVIGGLCIYHFRSSYDVDGMIIMTLTIPIHVRICIFMFNDSSMTLYNYSILATYR